MNVLGVKAHRRQILDNKEDYRPEDLRNAVILADQFRTVVYTLRHAAVRAQIFYCALDAVKTAFNSTLDPVTRANMIFGLDEEMGRFDDAFTQAELAVEFYKPYADDYNTD
jgi:hypothetical protein